MAHLGTIINLTSHRKPVGDPARNAMERHWAELAGGAVPARDAVDPGRMAAALDRVLLIERIAPRQARIRIAGQRISALSGMDPRGMPLSSLVVPTSREWLGDAIEALFDGPARIEMGLAGPRMALRARLRAELLMLPLLDRDGRVNRALCYIDLPDRWSSGALRLEISGETRAALHVAAPQAAPAAGPDFARADRARAALRRRQAFQLVHCD